MSLVVIAETLRRHFAHLGYIAALLIPSGRRVEETMLRVPPAQDIRSACAVSAAGPFTRLRGAWAPT